jgi:hypothetical protein
VSYCKEQLSATPPQPPVHVHPSDVVHDVSSSRLHGVGDPEHFGTPDPGPVFAHQPYSLHTVPCGQSLSSRHFETQMFAPMHIVWLPNFATQSSSCAHSVVHW